MAANRENHLGFGTVEALIVIALVLVIAGVGGVIYHHHKHTNLKASTSAGSQTVPQQATSDSTNSAKPAQQYLVVSQWGVQLPLSDNIKDAYYVVSTDTQDSNGDPNTIWLGLKSLDSAGCPASSGNSDNGTPIGAILRVSPNAADPVSGTLYTQLYPNGVTIGNYYYAYKSMTQGKTCASQASLSAINSSFATAAKGAVAASTTRTVQ